MAIKWIKRSWWLAWLALGLSACGPTGQPEAAAPGSGELQVEAPKRNERVADVSKYDEYQIITLLPPDAIPAIDDPTFLTAAEAAEFYEADELVIGVVFNGEARAYSVPHLSSHEIVNDTVGGVKIAVTW